MTFETKRLGEEDTHVFPPDTPLPDAVIEIMHFAATREKGERIAFIAGGNAYEFTAGDIIRAKPAKMTEDDIYGRIILELFNMKFEGWRLRYVPAGPEPLEASIATMLYLADQRHMEVVAAFDEELAARPGDNRLRLHNAYLLAVMARDEECRKLPAVKAFAEAREQAAKERKREFLYLVDNLPDFQDLGAVIRYLERVGECVPDKAGAEAIVTACEKGGLGPYPFAPVEFDPESAVSCAHMIIGQFLGFLQTTGHTCRMTHQAAEAWHKKFGHE